MSIRPHVEIICDGCSENGPMGLSQSTAETFARQDGWQVEKSYPHHLCPNCQKIEASRRVWLTDTTAR